ncbi:hypothetical protein NL500_30905, partial [Klebsiella pneumoniae]|nr:hypothetical protein [Klebsiella pneumoniae]
LIIKLQLVNDATINLNLYSIKYIFTRQKSKISQQHTSKNTVTQITLNIQKNATVSEETKSCTKPNTIGTSNAVV